MSLIGRLFGFKEPTREVLKIVKIFAILIPAFAFSFQISTTFWMITIAESIGGGDYIAGIALVGVLVVVQLVIQTMLDYPTGAIGDWIGQRWVIASALICYGISFWLTSTIIPGVTPFSTYLMIYALMGLGASQESGAFDAWFDNNYRAAMPQDTDRKQYGVFSGKIGMIWQVSSTVVLLPGSWLALIYSRHWVFQIQAIMSGALAVLVLIIVRDLPGVREELRQKQSIKEYGRLLVDGVKFIGSSRFVALTFFGEILIWATGALWWNILLFPLYFSYLFTEVAVSAYRTIIFLPEAVMQERSGVWSKRFDPIKWTWRFRILQFCGFVFYLCLALITLAFPSPPTMHPIITINIPFTTIPFFEIPLASIIPIVGIFTIFVIMEFFAAVSNILTQRIMIDVIPNRIRNSLYSLRPTVAMLGAIPLLLFFSWLLPIYGFPLTFALVSVIALIGALLVRYGFRSPIPKAKDTFSAPDLEEALDRKQ